MHRACVPELFLHFDWHNSMLEMEKNPELMCQGSFFPLFGGIRSPPTGGSHASDGFSHTSNGYSHIFDRHSYPLILSFGHNYPK